ncbi:hypothetical protein FOG18_07545 [Legionella israelensis]|uniref:hypothetical protein n=1 Tax=Legionella israelensis TaxID=454 RepID=UPI00118058F3|nr:hypothetical protein [Legionella israelensis]QDP72421.1 hypothetical protein FOG18_07545 [Legionella israelensis]
MNWIILMSKQLIYKPDNDDCPPEGNSFSVINRFLDKIGSGSTKQVVRACVDDSGTKASGSASDETDVSNNSEGLILQGEPEGSLELTLQGQNAQKRHRISDMNKHTLDVKKEDIEKAEEVANENNIDFLEKEHETLEQTNESFFPYSTLPLS